MSCGHDVSRQKADRRGPTRALFLTLLLTAGFAVVEIVGGLFANSLAVLADAGHMIGDVSALGISMFAMWMASKPHTRRRTFGFHRTEVLAALLNGGTLVAIAAAICWHAVRRLTTPPEIASGLMMIVAVVGLVVNLSGMWLLGRHRHENLNVQGAFLHILGDALGSVGVLGAAAIIALTGWTPIDAWMSIVISVFIVVAGLRLVKQSVSILLESSPRHLGADELRASLLTVPGIEGIHDLHIWMVTPKFVSLSCHAQLGPGAESDDVLRRARAMLAERYRIDHVTIQPEKTPLCEGVKHCCMKEHRS